MVVVDVDETLSRLDQALTGDAEVVVHREVVCREAVSVVRELGGDVHEAGRDNASDAGDAGADATSDPAWVLEMRSAWDTEFEEMSPEQQERMEAARLAAELMEHHMDYRTMDGDIVLVQPQQPMSALAKHSWAEHRKYKAFRFDRVVSMIVSMVAPVLMMIGITTAYALGIREEAARQDRLLLADVLPYSPATGDSTAELWKGSLRNTGIVVGVVIATTSVFLVMFICGRMRALRRVLLCVIFCLLAGPWGYFLYQTMSLYRWELDAISYFLLPWNLACIGTIAIASLKPSSWLTRGCMLALCLGIAWPFIEFPEVTVWCTLVALALYDMMAVLVPGGPLKYVVERQEQYTGPPMPGLMYKGTYFNLGLGDFVFYGALAARAAIKGLLPLVAATLGILMGTVLTIIITTRSERAAIPALPASVFLGVVCYVTTYYSMQEYCEHFASQSLGLDTT